MPTQPVTALATTTATVPRRTIDDPRELSDDQLKDVIRAFNRRSLAVGVVTGATAIAVTAVLAPITMVGAFAAVPAYVIGYVLSSSLARRAAAAELGLTPRCLRELERATERAGLRRDVRTMKAREWLVADVDVAARLTRVELARAGMAEPPRPHPGTRALCALPPGDKRG